MRRLSSILILPLFLLSISPVSASALRPELSKAGLEEALLKDRPPSAAGSEEDAQTPGYWVGRIKEILRSEFQGDRIAAIAKLWHELHQKSAHGPDHEAMDAAFADQLAPPMDDQVLEKLIALYPDLAPDFLAHVRVLPEVSDRPGSLQPLELHLARQWVRDPAQIRRLLSDKPVVGVISDQWIDSLSSQLLSEDPITVIRSNMEKAGYPKGQYDLRVIEMVDLAGPPVDGWRPSRLGKAPRIELGFVPRRRKSAAGATDKPAAGLEEGTQVAAVWDLATDQKLRTEQFYRLGQKGLIYASFQLTEGSFAEQFSQAQERGVSVNFLDDPNFSPELHERIHIVLEPVLQGRVQIRLKGVGEDGAVRQILLELVRVLNAYPDRAFRLVGRLPFEGDDWEQGKYLYQVEVSADRGKSWRRSGETEFIELRWGAGAEPAEFSIPKERVVRTFDVLEAPLVPPEPNRLLSNLQTGLEERRRSEGLEEEASRASLLRESP